MGVLVGPVVSSLWAVRNRLSPPRKERLLSSPPPSDRPSMVQSMKGSGTPVRGRGMVQSRWRSGVEQHQERPTERELPGVPDVDP